MNREEALAFRKKNGPPPEPPAPEDRKCEHKGNIDRLCSCHLSLEELAAAQELKDYTLYLFGLPYRGRVKVPYHPALTMAATDDEGPARGASRGGAAPASAAQVAEAKRDYDRLWRAAKAEGPDALARFKADWKARKAAA